jgi:hypothetical protein
MSTPSQGSWASKSAAEFLLTYINFSYDHEGNATGTARIRQTATLSADGKSYTGRGDFIYTDLKGEVVLAGAFTITATRIQVEAPSATVGTALDETPFLKRVKMQRRLRRISR